MLKCFDYKCNLCDAVKRDVIMPAEEKTFICGAVIHEEGFISPSYCPGTMERTWLMGRDGASSVHGDECDVMIRHGLCHEDGTPRRYTSKSDIRKEAQRRGVVNHVVHEPDSKGSDKSKHTQRFV